MEDFIPLPNQPNVIPKVPKTEIYLCAGIEWDNSYQNVRGFNNEPELLAYVQSKCPSLNEPYHITTATPISVGELKVRIPEFESKIMGLNYLAFNNKGFQDRWFYCFITGTKWLSDNSCIITFEYDIFQNCFYRASRNACFVEREHIPISEDTYGGNLIPDNLDPGEIQCFKNDLFGFGALSIGMLLTESLTGKQVNGRSIGNVYQGAELTILQDEEGGATKESLANGLLSSYTDAGKIDAVVDVFMIPELCRQQDTKTITVNTTGAFGGYVPKNKKLYSYPFIYELVDNNSGSTGTYRFEFSTAKNNALTFSFRGELCPLPAVMMRTENYEFTGVGYKDAMSYTGFPMCSWNSDVYRAWAAQNKNSIALSSATNALQPIKQGIQGAILGGLVGGAAGALAGGTSGVVNGAFSAFENQAQLMAQAKDRAIEPAQIHGKASNLNLNAAISKMNFNLYLMSSTYDVARSIDSYWDKYGYPIKRIKAPNVTSRPYWNFIKTVGCCFTGDFPPEMTQPFRAIFDRGVTIWHTNDIGNYGLNNYQ